MSDHMTNGAIAAKMNLLPFVRWDRYIESYARVGEHRVDVYGWIDRPDSHADFVVLTFGEWTEQIGWITSSSQYDLMIRAALDPPGAESYACQRVEDRFGVANAVRLAGR